MFVGQEALEAGCSGDGGCLSNPSFLSVCLKPSKPTWSLRPPVIMDNLRLFRPCQVWVNICTDTVKGKQLNVEPYLKGWYLTASKFSCMSLRQEVTAELNTINTEGEHNGDP